MDPSKLERKENPLGYAPVMSLIRQFAVPAIISMLVNTIYNITDQIFIGHTVGMLGNAATNVAFPVVTLTTALSQLVGIGTAANFNLCMGAKQPNAAKQYVGTGLTLSVAVGLLLGMAVLLLKTPIVLLCGATDTVLPLAQAYLGVTALGIPFLLFSSTNNMLVRADGSPRYSMLCMVSGAIINVGLDALFLLVFGWGIRGAALATIIGQMISFGLCLRYFFHFRAFRITRNMLGLRAAEVVNIAKLGLSNFLNQIVMMIVNIVLNNTLTYYGAMSIYGSDIPLAVSGVVAKLNGVMISFAVGLAQGCQPIFSFNMGAKKYGRLKETYKKAVSLALVLGFIAFAVFQLFPRQITSIFGTGSPLYFTFAEKYLRIYMMMVCINAVQPLTVNYFTAIGDVRKGIILSLSRQGLFLLPLLVLLPLAFGLNGVLYAGPIAEILAFILAVASIVMHFRRLGATEK